MFLYLYRTVEHEPADLCTKRLVQYSVVTDTTKNETIAKNVTIVTFFVGTANSTYETCNNVTIFVWTANNTYEQCNNCYIFRMCCSFTLRNLYKEIKD